MNMIFKRVAVAGAAALLAFSSGCTVAKFDSPEQAKRKAEEQDKLAVQSATVSPAQMMTDNLSFSRELKTSGGVVLATYTACVPQFITTGAKSTVFEHLNSFYQDEYNIFEEDCALFFGYVKQAYGEKWDSTAADAAKLQTTVFSYEMLEAPEKYISLLRTFETTDSSGAAETRYYAEVFDRETGWRLKFSDLFGSNASKAQDRLMEQLKAWCTANKLTYETEGTLAAADLIDEFTVTESELIICLDPFALSVDDGAGRLCRLPLSDFEDLMGVAAK